MLPVLTVSSSSMLALALTLYSPSRWISRLTRVFGGQLISPPLMMHFPMANALLVWTLRNNLFVLRFTWGVSSKNHTCRGSHQVVTGGAGGE